VPASALLATDTPWDTFVERWSTSAPPLRPHADVCAAVRQAIGGRTPALLLGVTPELTSVAGRTIAVDGSDASLRRIWPGNTAARHAVRADWRALPIAPRAVGAAIGDGTLNCLEYPHDYERLLQQLSVAVRDGGRIAIRTYLTPARGESVTDVGAAAVAGRIGSVHAFKWRLAMALCAETGDANLPAVRILDAFNRVFPDRAGLRSATGWTVADLAQIDVYRDASDVFSFPTAAQLLGTAPARLMPRLVPSGSYELAERCPLLIMDVRA
jgi:hypothetical protein